MPKEVLNVKYLLHLGSFDVSLTILYMFYQRFSIIQSMIHYKLNLLRTNCATACMCISDIMICSVNVVGANIA